MNTLKYMLRDTSGMGLSGLVTKYETLIENGEIYDPNLNEEFKKDYKASYVFMSKTSESPSYIALEAAVHYEIPYGEAIKKEYPDEFASQTTKVVALELYKLDTGDFSGRVKRQLEDIWRAIANFRPGDQIGDLERGGIYLDTFRSVGTIYLSMDEIDEITGHDDEE